MLIVNEKQGRFANRLISFSFFIANSIDHNYTLIYPYFAKYKSFFEATDFSTFAMWASYYGKIPLKQLEYADDTVNLNSDFEIRESLM